LVRPDWYCIEGGRYLLVELSNYSIPAQIEEYFTKLGDQEIRPIITHPERNPILQQNPQPRIESGLELGCAVQVTASAVTGYWGERTWRIATWLLERDAVPLPRYQMLTTPSIVCRYSQPRARKLRRCAGPILRRR